MSRRRITAIVRKEIRTYRRTRSIVLTAGVIPVVFLIQPLVSAFDLSTRAAAGLKHHHELLYMLGIPALVPAMLAAYAIVGERQYGTLEPVLSTPIRREELVLGKALAVLAPCVLLAYALFGLFIALVALFAHAGVASALLRPSDVVAQILFTPLIAGWSTWVAIAISTRASEVRVAQQLSTLASVPVVIITSMIAFDAIHPSSKLALGAGIALVVANRVGWVLDSRLFDRERLITASR